MSLLRSRLRDALHSLHNLNKYLFHWNFYRIHLTYFIFATLLASVILYGSNTSFHLSYSDALFLCASSITNTGLNTVNLSVLTAWQQAILFILMLMGDLTIITVVVVYIRKRYFRKRLRELVERNKVARQVADDIEKSHEGHRHQHIRNGRTRPVDLQAFEPRQRRKVPVSRENPTKKATGSYARGYGGFPAPWEMPLFRRVSSFPFRSLRAPPDSDADHRYLTFRPFLDKKGRFQSLSEEQMQELGGVEYRALKLLSWLLPAYSFSCLILTMLFLLPYSARKSISATLRNSQPGDLNPQWWAFFLSASSYSNTGLDLMDQSMIPFADNYFILIVTGTAILIGNTLYPVFLRLVIWILSKIIPKDSEKHHSLAFLLHHPRRCYLLLFPKKNTWYLLTIQVGINLLAWVLFILLNLGYGPVNSSIPNAGQRVMDGLYQAHGLRAAGYSIITISSVAPALQVFYMVIMYISAYPFIMSVRQTNVYEERSLGIDDPSTSQLEKQDSGSSLLASHIRAQLAYDLWLLLLAIFLVCIIERHGLSSSAPGFSIFSVVFEVVSAYGTVGLSLGVPYNNYSFCGAWHTLSKIILIIVMLRGRHRILPAAVDRAVLVPGQGLMERLDREFAGRVSEKDEEEIRMRERGGRTEMGEGRVDPEEEEGAGTGDGVDDGTQTNHESRQDQ